MKKLLSLSLVAIMLLAALGISIGAEDAPAYKEGDVLYSSDFTSMDELTANPDFSVYGHAVDINKSTQTIDNGSLRVVSQAKRDDETDIRGRFGTRIRLYKIPENVDVISVNLDLKINEFFGNTNHLGPALLLADNGEVDTDTSSGGSLGKFSMIWMRIASVGTSGAYTYGDTSLNVVNSKIEGICVAGSYNVRVYIDIKSREGVFSITNKDTGAKYEEENGFYYNTADVAQMIGLYANGVDVSFENITVYYGDGVFDGKYKAAETTPPATTAAPETNAPTATDKATEKATDKATEKAETKDPAATGAAVEKPIEEKNNTGLIIAIIAAVVVVCAVVAVVVVKKKKK